MGSRNKVAGQCVRSSKERGRGEKGEVGMEVECEIGLYHYTPDCRAVREQRLSVK